LPAGNTSETRTSIFDYDPVTGVLIKEVIEPNNPDLCLVTTYTQDSYGNVATKTTRNCNGSGPTLSGAYAEGAAPAAGTDAVFTARSGTTVYDNRGQFPATVTNALNQSETHVYDARFGTRTSLTGPNGLTTTWVYDGYGRTVQETRADGTYSVIGYPNPAGTSGAPCTGYGQWTYNQTIICYQIYSISYSSTGAQIGQPVYTYLDQANRKLFSTRINFANTDWIDDGLTYYDALGRVDKTFRPYERNTWPAKNAVLAIKNYYDVLGRVTEAHDFFTGSDTLVKSASYSALVTQTTVYTGNQSPQTTIATKNVAGQTALMEDPAGGRIRYAYDANNNLLGTDANGILNTVSYDLRGRKTGMADADMGGWQYAYNALGELIRQVDALSQTTTLQYDVLGRMTRRTEVGLDSKWEFDTNRSECASSSANNRAIGKLTAAFTLMADGVTPNSTRISCYDSLGRSSRELTTLAAGGTTYTNSVSYDTAGRVDTATYPAGPSNPAGFVVRNVYNAQGYPSQLVRVSTSAVLWQGNGVDAFGHVTNETMGNGLVTQRTYDDRGRSMLVTTGTTQTVNTASALQYNGTTYNNIDQVLQRNWVNAGVTISETYTYDDLNQITAVASSLGGLANKNYVYDYNGNFITKDGACTNGRGTANCQYNYTAGTHKLASITGTVQGTSGIAGGFGVTNPTYQYDANGNLKIAADLTINWTGFNMPLSIIRGTVNGVNKTDTFTYGPEHQRLKQVATLPSSSGTMTTLYLASFEQETNSDTGAIDYKYYLSAGGRSLGVFVDHYTTAAPGGTPTDVRYFHQDQLGSVVAVTDFNGAVIELLNYDAFGKRRNPDGTDSTNTLLPQNDRGYTGHEMLDTVGLIHMNGRIYDPTLGRFMSADPYIQAMDTTLSYNRYIYVMNDPFVLTDPSGYWSFRKWLRSTARLLLRPPTGIPKEDFKTVANFIRDQPGQEYVDAYVRKNAWAYSVGMIVTTVFSAPCGGCGGAAFAMYYSYEATGSVNAALRTGVITDVTSYASGYVDGLNLGATGTIIGQGVVGGVSARLQGGSFEKGFMYSAAAAGAMEIYKGALRKIPESECVNCPTYKPGYAPGEGVDDKYPQDSVKNPYSNNIGKGSMAAVKTGTVEGSAFSNFVNQIPVMNSMSVMHDSWTTYISVMKESSNMGILFYSSIPVAYGITVAAVLSETPAVVVRMAVNNSKN